mmetsp:Transcript_132581/g.383240  ORF Transcript_132581/g.383240 Transcript_132581/m.383240 type:complete len:133 (+) Transcript_132581:66-464(+)
MAAAGRRRGLCLAAVAPNARGPAPVRQARAIGIAALVVLTSLESAEASPGMQKFKLGAGYCVLCCGLMTAFFCGLCVVWFILQSKAKGDDDTDPWRKFEGKLESNVTVAKSSVAAAAAGAARLLRRVSSGAS